MFLSLRTAAIVAIRYYCSTCSCVFELHDPNAVHSHMSHNYSYQP